MTQEYLGKQCDILFNDGTKAKGICTVDNKDIKAFLLSNGDTVTSAQCNYKLTATRTEEQYLYMYAENLRLDMKELEMLLGVPAQLMIQQAIPAHYLVESANPTDLVLSVMRSALFNQDRMYTRETNAREVCEEFTQIQPLGGILAKVKELLGLKQAGAIQAPDKEVMDASMARLIL